MYDSVYALRFNFKKRKFPHHYHQWVETSVIKKERFCLVDFTVVVRELLQSTLFETALL